MVVGDDDQAIYSFQGAEVGNILAFKDKFEAARIVTLTDNYRSADVVLKQARSVITLGQDRLENYVDEIEKTLIAQNDHAEGNVHLYEYERIEDERRGLAKRIKAQIDDGEDPGNIAVLARRHHELVSLLPYLHDEGISVNYERRDNVLDADVVQQLCLLANIIVSIADSRFDEADGMLPRLLSHPAWGIDPEALWSLSMSAYRRNVGWLEEMSVRPDFKPLHTWLFESAQLSLREPAEAVLDRLVGNAEQDTSAEFSSPIYSHYFSSHNIEANAEEYLTFLEALRTIRSKLREYRPDQSVALQGFIEFVELHQRMGSVITSVRVRSDITTGAVHLMTAHKSKGLEFKHVHIFGAIDTSWGERVRSKARLIGYPENLPLRPSGESFDERLRLFFVAMTRAKRTLTITYSLLDANGKPSNPASFLVSDGWQPQIEKGTASAVELVSQLEAEWYRPLLDVEQKTMLELLAPSLESYKLSVTHLNTFLDVSRGGPQNFLLTNLLRFPQQKTPQASYGSAIHRTLQRAHDHLVGTKKPKPLEDILQDYEKQLAGMRLSQKDLLHYTQYGQEVLQAFMSAKGGTFTQTQRTELNFSSQQSRVGNTVLTGSLDLVDIDETTKEVIVTDYKTGKCSSSWNGREDWEKIKLHKYRQQLLFYKLLVEKSRDYSQYTVRRGVLQFVEPDAGGKIVALDLEYDKGELERFSRLVEAVYDRIARLDLPESSNYSPDYKGMLQLETDLLGESID
jgi:DNA helicase-2/ATP-dependent DNA helicase PcrA